MKNSGVEWIGYIPCSWEILPIHSAFVERREKVSDIEWEPLSVTKSGVVKQLEHAAKSNNHNDRKKVCVGDFAINSRSDRKESCGLSSMDGSVSLINTVLIANASLYSSKYVKYLLKNYGFAEEFYRWGTGIVADLWSTNFERMKNIKLPFPPLSEQQKIADFLDEKVKEIDNAIEKTKETIELYKKYKQAIITEAVTKGLDPNVEMKDSGVEWIGKIPVDWQVKRAKNVVTEFAKGAGITKEDVDINGDISCVRYGEIYTKYDIDFVQTFSRTSLSQINTPKYIEKGDILFSGTGELVEEIGKNIVYLGNEPCIAGGDIIIAKHKCNASFLNYAFKSSYSQMQKSSGKSKLKVVHISASDIGNILLAIPPACEQEAIANYLNQKIDLINFINKSLNELVPMFENYKKSLIYEYVTGKKEVK